MYICISVYMYARTPPPKPTKNASAALNLFRSKYIFNSYKEGIISFRLEASSFLYSCYIQLIQGRQSLPEWKPFFFCLQLLYAIHTRKAFTLSEWRPLSFLYNCYIQLIQGRHSLSEWRPLSCFYSCYIQLIQRKHTIIKTQKKHNDVSRI